MARLKALALTLVLLLVAAPVEGAAQERPSLQITLPAATALGEEGPTVRVSNVLSDRRVRELLRNGFPARLHFRADLWSADGWFNSLIRSAEWDVVVRYDALREQYEAVRVVNDTSVIGLGRYAQFADVETAIEQPMRAPILPTPRRGSQYYNLTLQLEMISVSDLDELERWLRGELRPAVRGQRNPGTALGRGVRTLLVRVLGGESRRLETRSRTFVFSAK